MRCSKARELISDALDLRLDESGGLDLSHHLSDCPDCRAHQSVLQRGREFLQQDMVEPSENFEWKVQLKIQQALREKAVAEEPLTGWKFWRPALASAAGVAAVVVMAGGIFLSGGDVSGPGSMGAVGSEFASSRQVVAAEPVLAEADLSGAVRSQPLRINAASGGFGIRTVADQQFAQSSPFRDPTQRVPVRWLQEGNGEAIEVREVSGPDGSQHYVMWRRVGGHGGSLNLELHRYKVREVRETNPQHEDPDS